MSIFETIGLVWVVLTSALATVGIFALAYEGLKARVALVKKKDIEIAKGASNAR